MNLNDHDGRRGNDSEEPWFKFKSSPSYSLVISFMRMAGLVDLTVSSFSDPPGLFNPHWKL